MIDHNSDRAKYKQLADDLREEILSGRLQHDAAIPSEKRLQQEYGLSRTAVRSGIDILKHEGLIEVAAPRGTFVRTAPPTEVVTLRRGDELMARMPLPKERAKFGIREGVPLFIVTRGTGKVEYYAADIYKFRRTS